MKILDKLHEKLVEPFLAEGRAEGISEYRDWLTRKEEAEAKGELFSEPPPQPFRDELPNK